MIWTILYISAAIVLILFWKGPNAVWGGFTLGIVVGTSIAIVSAIKGDGFIWSTVGKVTALGALIGLVAELLGRCSSLLKR